MTEQTEGSGPSELELLKARARLLGVEFSNNIKVDTLRERVNAKIAEIEGDEQETAPATAPVSEGDQSLPEKVDTANTGAEDPFDDDIEEEEAPQGDAPVNGFDAAAQIAQAKASAPPTAQIKPIIPNMSPTVEPTVGAKVGQPIAPKKGKTPTLRQYMYNEQMRLVRVRIQNLDPKKADLPGEIITIANKHLGSVKVFVPYGEVTDDGWHIPYIVFKELNRRRFLSIRTIKDPRTKQPVVKKAWAKEFALDILDPLSEAELKQLAAAQAAAGSIDSGSNDII